MAGFSGKITFYWYQVHIKTDNGIDVDYVGNPGWDIGDGGKTLVSDGVTPTIHHNGSERYPPVVLTFLKISPNLIELRDPHGDTIFLTRPLSPSHQTITPLTSTEKYMWRGH